MGSNRAALERVGGTADTAASGSGQNVGVNHRGLQILVSQKLLDRPDIVSLFEQMGGEGMPKGMTAHGFLDSDVAHSLSHRTLDGPILQVMSPLDTRAGILAPALGRKEPLPAPLGGCARILSLESVEVDTGSVLLDGMLRMEARSCGGTASDADELGR